MIIYVTSKVGVGVDNFAEVHCYVFLKISSCKLCHNMFDVEPTEETYHLSSSPPSQ